MYLAVNNHNVSNSSQSFKKKRRGTSLVVQWLRIHLPMQGTWVPSFVWELESHMLQAAKPTGHSYFTHALEPTSCNY